jgi:nucleoside-diphosphate-sugar epimerase
VDSAFITGASGHIGRALGERLRADGIEVAGVDLQTDKGRHVVAGDLSVPAGWQRVAQGAEVVFHTPARGPRPASRELAWQVNVLGTRHALEAAIAGGARRFVHLSSVRVFGEGGFPDGVAEQHPVRLEGNPQTDAMIAAEQVVLQAHAAGEAECVVLRAGDIYGPESRQWTVLPVEAIRAGRFVLPARGSGIFSPLFVENLTDALALAGTKPHVAGQVFNVTDGVGISCLEFFGHYERMLGRGGSRTLPTWAAGGLAGVTEVIGRAAGYDITGRRAEIRYLARTGTYAIAKARKLLDYEPRFDLTEGMRRTESWLREQGLLS